MLVGRMVKLIEDHADELVSRMVRKLREDPGTSDYRRFGDEELAERARRVYSQLHEWISRENDDAVADEYFVLGQQRAHEGVPLANVVQALFLIRRNLWDYVEGLGADTMLELRQHHELELTVVRFFDRAIYNTVRGYESAAFGEAPMPEVEEGAPAVTRMLGGFRSKDAPAGEQAVD